jgi:hypothetical protein
MAARLLLREMDFGRSFRENRWILACSTKFIMPQRDRVREHFIIESILKSNSVGGGGGDGGGHVEEG